MLREMEADGNLRRGWTTGACATAAAKAAYNALLTGIFPDPVEIRLPRGERPSFALARAVMEPDAALVSIVKDAGDDPDVTHGALVSARVRLGGAGSGIVFKAGEGVGTVTRPGLALAVGEPAINPVPRQMMRAEIEALARTYGASQDAIIEISVENGEALATRTLNGRLGIQGGLSILGTTGIVIPYSCSAWIASIHRGIDVAIATGVAQIAGATGKTSEAAVRARYDLPETALIDMGDFVGGMLKYLRTHPVPRLSIAGGVAKMTKLAQGRMDLHSARGSADFEALAALAGQAGADAQVQELIRQANTVAQVFEDAAKAGIALGDEVARHAWQSAAAQLGGTRVALEILIYDRNGLLVGDSAGFHLPHAPPPRNLR